MAYQLSTVRTRVQQKLDNTAFDLTKLTQFVNDGQRDIFGAKRLPFMEREATLTSSIGSAALATYPTDLESTIALRIYSPTDYARVLTYQDYEDFDERHPNPTASPNGVPSVWTLFNKVLSVYPAADAVYTLKLKYYKTPTELVNDTDVPEIPEQFGELLVLAAYKRALMHDDNFDQAQVIQQDIEDYITNMVLRTSRRTIGQVHVMRQPRNLRSR